jgi:hypothetical protein
MATPPIDTHMLSTNTRHRTKEKFADLSFKMAWFGIMNSARSEVVYVPLRVLTLFTYEHDVEGALVETGAAWVIDDGARSPRSVSTKAKVYACQELDG